MGIHCIFYQRCIYAEWNRKRTAFWRCYWSVSPAAGSRTVWRMRGNKGVDWTNWNGEPTGYEGFLADSFRFLQIVLVREPQMREMLYYPMNK